MIDMGNIGVGTNNVSGRKWSFQREKDGGEVKKTL